MRYSALVIKLPNNKFERFRFNVIYGGIDHKNVISKKQLSRLLKITHSKFKAVQICKTKYHDLNIQFHGDKELSNFYLESKEGDIISLKDYINISLMMNTNISKHKVILVDNNDYINNTEITFVMYNNTVALTIKS